MQKILLFLLLLAPSHILATNASGHRLTSNPEIFVKRPLVVTYSEDEQLGRKRAIRKGRKAYARHEYEDALHWFELAVNIKGGSAISMYYLGMMYFLGLGTKVNSKYGIAYLEAAAESGFEPALFDLGVIYFHGFEIPKDLSTAEVCFTELPFEIPKYRFYKGKVFYELACNDEDKIRGLSHIISAANDGYEPAKEEVKYQNIKAELSYLKKMLETRKLESKDQNDN